MDRALPRRAYLGLDLEVAAGGGLGVVAVAPGSGAHAAGLRQGDGVMSIAGEAGLTLEGVRRLAAGLVAGQPCAVELMRDGAARAVELTVGGMPLERLDGGAVELSHVEWEGHRLRTVWSWPTTGGPHPVVWIVPGLTWISDEHPLQPAHPTFQLVQGLTRAGYATLRVERSGLGDSEGPPCTQLDLDAELAGFCAGRAQLLAHPRVDPRRRFMFGRSLGGMLVPLLARGQAMAGVAVWGSSADDWLQTTLTASARQFALGGMRGVQLRAAVEELDRLANMLYVERLTPAQAYAREPALQRLQPRNFDGQRIYGRDARFFHQLQAADVAGAWGGVDCPVLAMYGDCDYVTCRQDLEGVVAAAAPHAELAVLPGVDHHLHDRDSLQAAFEQPWGGEFSPRALARLVEFLDAQGGM